LKQERLSHLFRKKKALNAARNYVWL
jgi:hypothetical protein